MDSGYDWKIEVNVNQKLLIYFNKSVLLYYLYDKRVIEGLKLPHCQILYVNIMVENEQKRSIDLMSA